MNYPDDNPKTVMGLAKPPFRAIPPVALIHFGRAMMDGLRKYGIVNWRDAPVTASTYYDAALRHLLAYWDGEDTAEDSGVDHLGHVMACCAIILDAREQGTLNDDRGTKGMFSKLVAKLTIKAAPPIVVPVPTLPLDPHADDEARDRESQDIMEEIAPDRESAKDGQRYWSKRYGTVMMREDGRVGRPRRIRAEAFNNVIGALAKQPLPSVAVTV